jgi:hypothetical protein
MKKVVFVGLLILVISMVFSGIPIFAEAQTDPSILLKIASQAHREVKQQISSDSSEEVQRLFEAASHQVVLLEQSLENGNMTEAKQHFLSAMEMFKKITQMISSDRPTEKLESPDISTSSTSQRDHISDLERIKKLISTLKSIERSQSVNFDEADKLVTQAENQIRENDDAGLEATLDQLKGVLNDIQKELRKHASQTTTARTIKFFNDMLNRLENRGVDQNLLSEARQMLANFEQLIADGSYDEAKQLRAELTEKIRELYKSIP